MVEPPISTSTTLREVVVDLSGAIALDGGDDAPGHRTDQGHHGRRATDQQSGAASYPLALRGGIVGREGACGAVPARRAGLVGAVRLVIERVGAPFGGIGHGTTLGTTSSFALQRN